MILELLILAALAVWLVFALRSTVRRKGGCGGDCAHCCGGCGKGHGSNRA
ncbi:MAG: FeoB-associated Cys-rich membrane protein [Oscillibacter sp.]|jgi:hypothetical protein|nr:FeoB-associated Cys-rich membrane protein [Oscillibacter sp.]